MSNFTKTIKPPQVLILDAPSTPTSKTQFNYSACAGFFRSLGCYVGEYNQHNISASHQVLRDEWDLICLPNIQVAGDFTALAALLALFDSPPPVYIANMINGAGSGEARAVTGLLTAGATTDITCAGLENWQGRKSGQVSFYSNPILTYENDVTIHAQAAGNVVLASRTISGCNTLMQVGYSSQNATIVKPWLGAQWMIDNAATERAVELKAQLRKRRCLLRIDGLSNAATQAAYDQGDMQTIYDTCIEYGIKEAWVPDIWDSATSADTLALSNTTVLDWFLAKSETTAGGGQGLFRHTQHEIDVHDGTNVYDTNIEACSSNGILFDQFKKADYAYRWACDQLTGYGFVIGTDGYGRGYPNVQNANDMSNPSAKFLCSNEKLYDTDGFKGGYGCHPWVSGDQDYPTSESIQVSICGSIRWYDGNTLLSYSEDGVNPATAAALATTWNADLTRSFINGGAIYYHPLTTSGTYYFAQYVDEFGQLFTSCPDVVDSGTWEEMLAELKHGNGVFFNG